MGSFRNDFYVVGNGQKDVDTTQSSSLVSKTNGDLRFPFRAVWAAIGAVANAFAPPSTSKVFNGIAKGQNCAPCSHLAHAKSALELPISAFGKAILAIEIPLSPQWDRSSPLVSETDGERVSTGAQPEAGAPACQMCGAQRPPARALHQRMEAGLLGIGNRIDRPSSLIASVCRGLWECPRRRFSEVKALSGADIA